MQLRKAEILVLMEGSSLTELEVLGKNFSTYVLKRLATRIAVDRHLCKLAVSIDR